MVPAASANLSWTQPTCSTSFRKENSDSVNVVEQNLFPAAVYGADLCDLHVAIAPRPLMAMIECAVMLERTPVTRQIPP